MAHHNGLAGYVNFPFDKINEMRSLGARYHALSSVQAHSSLHVLLADIPFLALHNFLHEPIRQIDMFHNWPICHCRYDRASVFFERVTCFAYIL